MSNASPASPIADDDAALKRETRRMWAMGDYARFAETLVWELGEIVVNAAAIKPGMRVLDVACGTGNVALRAAAAGATVVAGDLTPENFPAGQAHAARLGVEIDWREADAECLPFETDQFDAVLSSVGAIFAPRHQRVADELIRVCKPGGTIVMANFTPEGIISEFFSSFAEFLPEPRPGDHPPPLWGDEQHVKALFGDRIQTLECERKTYFEHAESAVAYCEFCKETFGPIAAIYESIADRPAKVHALDRAFLAFAERNNVGQGPATPFALAYEYLLVVATLPQTSSRV